MSGWNLKKACGSSVCVMLGGRLRKAVCQWSSIALPRRNERILCFFGKQLSNADKAVERCLESQTQKVCRTYLVVYFLVGTGKGNILGEPVSNAIQLLTLGPVVECSGYVDLGGRMIPMKR